MKDRFIEGYLKAFIDEYGLHQLDEPSAFERFANYCILSKHYADSFDPDDVTVAGGNELGLDGIGILVNDNLAFSTEDVNYFKKHLRRLDAQFVFVQAKTSAHFDVAEIGNFGSGVRRFFEKKLPEKVKDAVVEFHKVKEHIFDCVVDMDRSPICYLYFVTTGSWLGDAHLKDRMDQVRQDLESLRLFSQVEFVPIDAENLKRLYRDLHQKITREFAFEKHAILPGIAKVQAAYIGIVPCLEYLKLIRNEDGSLNRRLFYDNVRDFQGHNSVNSKIEATVKDSSRSDRFSLLNNGVTIVARDVLPVGTVFRLRDYQIVNGCQTSHILYLNQQHLNPNVYLPIKLIHTTDSEVTNQIIEGTNSQTEVKQEAFEALLPFQKELEELYVTLGRDRPEPLYYERRSKQHEQAGVQRDRIITLATQIKCFVAMFLNEPHSTHRYYGELLSSYRDRVFGESHSLMPYFASGLALAVVERLFARGALRRELKTFKFQLLMVLRLQNEHREIPPLNRKKAIDPYCQELIALLDNSEQAEAAIVRASELVTQVWDAASSGTRHQPERSRHFTTALIDAATAGRGANAASTARRRGSVDWFNDLRGFGNIRAEDGEKLYVHARDIRGSGFRSLTLGQPVAFDVVSEVPLNRAVDVEVLR